MSKLACLWSSTITASLLLTASAGGQAIIWEADFSGQTDKGITAGPGTNMNAITSWSVSVHDTFPTNAHFMVVSNTVLKEYFEGYRLGGECVWESEPIDISMAGPVDLSLQLQETGTMIDSDSIGIYYRLDDSNETLFAENGFFAGDYGSTWITAAQPYLSGTNVQIVVRMITTEANKKHRIDNIRVTETSIVSDSPPAIVVADGDTNRFAMVGDTVQFTLTATENLLDADTDIITLWAEGLPTNAAFAATNGLSPLSQVFFWTPSAPGSETVAFYASDKDGTNRLDVTISVSQLDPGRIWINEIHYDNTGIDTDEGVEVAGPAGYQLNGHKVYFYNGSGGGSYDELDLAGTIDNEGEGFGAVWFAHSGIQNDMDGMALVREVAGETNVLQFLTYEGSFVATDGPATGLTGVDIGVEQSNTTTLTNQTLQLTGKGKVYADFSWTGPVAESRGRLNAGQKIVRPGFVFIVR